MDGLYYRFRNLEKLLGDKYQELKNQTIYFAAPSEWNDPMDGFREFYWKGDKIVWKNLFKNFLICLERIASLFLIYGENEEITNEMIPVFSNEDDYPTLKYKELYVIIEKRIFSREDVDSFITAISRRTTNISRDELTHYLKRLHPVFLNEILEIYKQEGLLKKNPLNEFYNHTEIKQLLDKNIIIDIEKTLSSSNSEENNFTEVFFKSANNAYSQMELLQRYNGDIDNKEKNKNFLLIEFVQRYLEQLETLVYPKWYASCFMTECNNSPIWGHYGANHTGVCLIFKADKDEHGDYIPFNDIKGWSNKGVIRGDVRYRFTPIDYNKKIVTMNFFNFLGSLPTQKIDKYWYRDGTEYSDNATQFNENIEEWRRTYWSLFYDAINRKSKDWSYECEKRVILNDMSRDHTDPKSRTLKYNFNSLDGIVFGIKTPIESKIKIIKIIDEKCVEYRTNHIKYYQAYYSHVTDRIEYDHLSLIKHQI